MQNLKYSTEHGKCRSRGQAAADLSKHWCRSWHFSVFIGFLIWRPSALLRNTIHKQNVIVSTFLLLLFILKTIIWGSIIFVVLKHGWCGTHQLEYCENLFKTGGFVYNKKCIFRILELGKGSFVKKKIFCEITS